MLKYFLFFLILATHSAYASVDFIIQESKLLKKISVEKNFTRINHISGDFSILYNSKNRMVYLKHKNLEQTFRISPYKITKKYENATLTQIPSKINIINYQTDLYNISTPTTQCFKIRTSQALNQASGASLSALFNIYQAFTYLTGIGQLNNNCDEIKISHNYDKLTGFPLAVFNKQYHYQISRIQNSAPAQLDKGFNLQNAIELNPQIQYHVLLSLLSKQQKDLFLNQQKKQELPLNMQIQALNNILTNKTLDFSSKKL